MQNQKVGTTRETHFPLSQLRYQDAVFFLLYFSSSKKIKNIYFNMEFSKKRHILFICLHIEIEKVSR